MLLCNPTPSPVTHTTGLYCAKDASILEMAKSGWQCCTYLGTNGMLGSFPWFSDLNDSAKLDAVDKQCRSCLRSAERLQYIPDTWQIDRCWGYNSTQAHHAFPPVYSHSNICPALLSGLLMTVTMTVNTVMLQTASPCRRSHCDAV